MKKSFIIGILLMILLMPFSTNAQAAKKENLPVRDYLILADIVYESSVNTTVKQELSIAQSASKKAKEFVFSESEEKKISSSWTRIAYQENSFLGFKAAAYYNPTKKEMVVAFPGTREIPDTVADVATVAANFTHTHTPLAKQFVTNVASMIGRVKYKDPITNKIGVVNSKTKIVLVGHSLGGYLVQLAGLELLENKTNSSKFNYGVTFNSLGIASSDVTDTQWKNNKYGKYNDRFVHYTITPEILELTNEAVNRIKLGNLKVNIYEPDLHWGPYKCHFINALYKNIKS